MKSLSRQSRTATSQVSEKLMTAAFGGKRRLRDAQAQAAWRRVLQKINAKRISPRVDRVLWLLEALIKAERLRLQLYEPAHDWVGKSVDYVSKYDAFRESFSDPELQALNLQFQNALKQIDQRLKRYRWTPTVRSGEFLGLGEWYIWPKKSAEDNWENWAVLWLIRHAVQGSSGRAPSLILRFGRCRQCHKWFYALTGHQEFCSDVCRKKFHSEQVLSTREGREEHARKMREYRFNKKEKDRKHDEAVKAAWTREKKGMKR